MGMLQGVGEKLKRLKSAEWAVLLIALGLAGSLLIVPGSGLLGLGGTGGQQQPSAGVEASDALEARLSRVLSSIEGAGRVEVVIYYAQPAAAVISGNGWLEPSAQQASGTGDPAGVVVVADGAGDITVRLELARAVQTLLRLDADAVEIFKMEREEQEE